MMLFQIPDGGVKLFFPGKFPGGGMVIELLTKLDQLV